MIELWMDAGSVDAHINWVTAQGPAGPAATITPNSCTFRRAVTQREFIWRLTTKRYETVSVTALVLRNIGNAAVLAWLVTGGITIAMYRIEPGSTITVQGPIFVARDIRVYFVGQYARSRRMNSTCRILAAHESTITLDVGGKPLKILTTEVDEILVQLPPAAYSDSPIEQSEAWSKRRKEACNACLDWADRIGLCLLFACVIGQSLRIDLDLLEIWICDIWMTRRSVGELSSPTPLC